LNEWRKLVNAKNKAEGFFTKIGGKSKNFKKAVTTGRARKKTGVRLSGIEELGAVATASGTAAASGFIVFAKKLLSSINPIKLFKKVATKVREKRAARNTSQSAIPSVATSSSFAPTNFNTNDFDADGSSFDAAANTSSSASRSDNGGNGKIGFMQKVKNFVMKHKKKILFVGITGVIGIIFLLVWHKTKKKKKNQLRGIKAAKTRARNRRNNLKGLPSPRKTRTKTIGRGSTRVIKTPVRGRGKTRVSTQSSGSRLSLMHAKAKQLQKKHPKTKYSNLLKMAAKQI